MTPECQKCGNCCRDMNSPPFMPPCDGKPGEVESLPWAIHRNYLMGMQTREWSGWPDGVPCFWLYGNECTQYNHRPAICREHKPGIRDDCPAGEVTPL